MQPMEASLHYDHMQTQQLARDITAIGRHTGGLLFRYASLKYFDRKLDNQRLSLHSGRFSVDTAISELVTCFKHQAK